MEHVKRNLFGADDAKFVLGARLRLNNKRKEFFNGFSIVQLTAFHEIRVIGVDFSFYG
jgi:hypothetical protein